MWRYPALSDVAGSLTREDRCVLSREDKCIAGVAGQIKNARESAGYSKSELAQKLHVSPSTMTLLEAGKRLPSLRMLVSIAFSTGLAVGYFFLDDDGSDGVNAKSARRHSGKYRSGDYKAQPLDWE